MYLGPKHKILSVLRSSAVYLVVLLIMFLVHLKTPIPPYPEGGGGPGMGLEVNLGVGLDGMGNEQSLNPVEMPEFKAAPKQVVQEEKILTSEDEESEAIKEAEKTDKKKPEKVQEKTVQKETVTQTQTQAVNKNALYQGRKTTNEGITGKVGDQGNPNGVVGSNIYTGSGQGSGGGTGGGSGTGIGTGVGAGISFSLEGRSSVALPTPEFNNQKEGKVVVQVTVDREGKVTNAIAGVKGSTTLDTYLCDVAKKAALSSRFSRKDDAPMFQTGTIEYVFRLR
jgi:TonB family protein